MLTVQKLKQLVRVKVLSGSPRLEWDKQDEWQQGARGFHLQLTYPTRVSGKIGVHRRAYTFDFWQGQLVGEQPDERPLGVLSCLVADARSADDTFEGFCSNLGYDTDSRKALAVYKACQRERKALQHVFGKDFDALMQLELD